MRVLWYSSLFAVIFLVCVERNVRVSRDHSSLTLVLLDQDVFMASYVCTGCKPCQMHYYFLKKSIAFQPLKNTLHLKFSTIQFSSLYTFLGLNNHSHLLYRYSGCLQRFSAYIFMNPSSFLIKDFSFYNKKCVSSSVWY